MNVTSSPASESASSDLRHGIYRPARNPRRVLVVAATAVITLVAIGFLLRSHPVDKQLSLTLNSAHVGTVGMISSAVYTLFEPAPAIILTMIVTATVWASTRRLRTAAAFAGVVALTWIPSDLAKHLVDRPRPDGHLVPHPFSPAQLDPSFPSGHAVFISAFVIAVVFVLRDTGWAGTGVIVGTALIAAVALALTIDAVHYPTDVLASIVWSVTIAPAARLVWVDGLLPRLLPPSR